MATRRKVIGAAVQNVVEYNAKRTSLLIQVISGGAINVAENQGDVAGEGFNLQIGDVFSRVRALGGQPELAHYAVRATADATIAIVEDFGAVEKGIEAKS